MNRYRPAAAAMLLMLLPVLAMLPVDTATAQAVLPALAV